LLLNINPSIKHAKLVPLVKLPVKIVKPVLQYNLEEPGANLIPPSKSLIFPNSTVLVYLSIFKIEDVPPDL
jgi:hypothetical protein